jgi:ABC-type multidrug transport system fused ATPase/permease subunit
VAIGLSVVGAATSLAQPLVVSDLVRRVQAAAPLAALLWLLVACSSSTGSSAACSTTCCSAPGTSVVLTARERLIRHVLKLPISEYDRRRTGDLVSRIGTDTTLLYAVLTQGLIDAVGGAVTLVGALIGMLVIDPLLLGLTCSCSSWRWVSWAFSPAGSAAASRRQQDAIGAAHSPMWSGRSAPYGRSARPARSSVRRPGSCRSLSMPGAPASTSPAPPPPSCPSPRWR